MAARQDRSGQRIRVGQAQVKLGTLIKSGGAGSVYMLPARPGDVAKLYHPTTDTTGYDRKIAAMLALTPNLPVREEHGHRYVQIAWPTAMVTERDGRFLGFTMPLLDIAATAELEPVLQERQAQRRGLPTGLGAKVTLAANLATALAAVHEQGHYVVDLKPVNLRFYKESLYIALLDCDGFSINGKNERFPAEQFTPDYLAPEFQGRGIDAGGEHTQDLFALAVIIFQLLDFGIHPFSGKPRGGNVPTDIPGRIGAHCYAYGLQPNARIAPSPVSGHDRLPDELRRLFDRAFTRTDRPDAGTWAQVLGRYARRDSGLIVPCKTDDTHQHFAGMACATCERRQLLRRAKAQSQARRQQRTRQRQAARRTARQATGARATPGVFAPSSGAATATARKNTLGGCLLWVGVIAVAFLALGRACSDVSSWDDTSTSSSSYSVTVPNTPSTSTTTVTPDTAQPEPAEKPAIERIKPVSVHPDTKAAADTIASLLAAANKGNLTLYHTLLAALRNTASLYPGPQPASVEAYYDAVFMLPNDPTKRVAEQLKLYGKITQDDPYAIAAVDALANLRFYHDKDPQAAHDLYILALALKPGKAANWYGLGTTLLALGHAHEATAAMAVGYALHDDADTWLDVTTSQQANLEHYSAKVAARLKPIQAKAQALAAKLAKVTTTSNVNQGKAKAALTGDGVS